MRNRLLLTRLFLLITGVFFLLPIVNAQTNRRLSFEVSPLYSYIDVRLGKYAGRNNPGLEDPQPGFGGAIKYEVDLSSLVSLSAGIGFERRHHAYSSVLYDTASPIIHLGDDRPYQLSYETSYDFIGIPVALHINYLNSPGLRVYQSFGTRFGFMAQSSNKIKWYYEDNSPYDTFKKGTDGKTDVVVSLTSSIGICKNLTRLVAFKIEPGISYMANNFFESSWAHMKYLDLIVDVGIVYNLYGNKDK